MYSNIFRCRSREERRRRRRPRAFFCDGAPFRSAAVHVFLVLFLLLLLFFISAAGVFTAMFNFYFYFYFRTYVPGPRSSGRLVVSRSVAVRDAHGAAAFLLSRQVSHE